MELGDDMPSLDLISMEELVARFSGDPQKLVDNYGHCPVCRSYLHFTHYTDFLHNRTEETAKCLECEMRVRKVLHVLQ